MEQKAIYGSWGRGIQGYFKEGKMNIPVNDDRNSSFTFEELNEISNVSRQCGVNVRGLREPTIKNQSCRMILKSVARIQEEDLGNIIEHTEFDVMNKPSFVNQGGMLVSASSMNVRLKSDVMRKIENLVD